MDQNTEKKSVKKKAAKVIDLDKQEDRLINKQSAKIDSSNRNKLKANIAKISWLPWSKKAFELAKKENKPILLDLSAVWCHWCHRMDHDTYDNPEVIDVITDKFVAIKVDIDQRPDIRDRYNFGGFPTTAFLTDTGKVITGHTYLQKYQMLHLLAKVSTFYNSLKIEAETKQSSMQAKKLLHNASNTEKQVIADKEITLSYNSVNKITEFLTSNFDPTFGGFGIQPKFPVTEAVELALLQCSKNTAKDDITLASNKKYTEIAKQTLKGMLGIFDKVEGGFFRYSVTQDWTLPHYEKMAESNSELIRNYLNAHQLLRESVGSEFKDIAAQTLTYVQNTLYDTKAKIFYASQDADEEYYKKSKEQRKKLSKPYVDKTIFTNLNAQMISGFLRASVVLNDKKYSDIALSALNYLYKNNTNKSGNTGNVSAGLIHYSISKKNNLHASDLDAHSGLLIDQVYMLRALLSIFQVTQDKKYLADAEKLFAYIKSNFYDKDDNAFCDRTISKEDIGYLQFPDKSLLDNSLLADCLVRLCSLTAKDKYHSIAAGILKAFSHDFTHYGFNAAGYALALEHYLFPIKIIIVAKKKNQVEELLNLVLAVYDPRKSVKLLTLEDKKELAEFGYTVEFTPTIYICYGTMCSRPMKSYEEFVKEFNRIKAIKK